MKSTPETTATPLIPVLPESAPRRAVVIDVPIEGGALQAIDDPELRPAGTLAVTAPAEAPAIDGTITTAVVSELPAGPASRRRPPPGLAKRGAYATSSLFNLVAFGGLLVVPLAAGALQNTFAALTLPEPAPEFSQAATRPPQAVPSASQPNEPSATTPPPLIASLPPPTLPEPSPPQAAALPVMPPVAQPETSPDITQAAAPVTRVLPAPATTPLRNPGTPQPATSAAPTPTEAIPAPSLLAAEIAHVARFDALIAPVRDAQPSLADATRLRDAMASTANLQQTRALRDQLTEPAARKLIDWALARGGSGSARDIKAFIEQNPNWPSRDLMTQRAEEQLFVGGGSVRDIKAFFDKGAPKTGIGMAALASAYLAEGDEAQATQLARAAWRRSDIPGSLENGFLDRFKKLLGEGDHKARFDRYMIDNTRWSTDRNDRANVARRVLPYLGDSERRKADARLAAYLRQPGADALLAALPADATSGPKADWGLAFQMAQANRRGGRQDAAWKILREAPIDAETAGNLDEWWEERRMAAYDALKSGKPKNAYDIVKAAGQLSVNPAKDQTFLAGWIALRYLNDPIAAEQHFAALEAVADGPLSRAKAGYWLARTFEAQKSPDKMRAPLERAARNVDTFYGQLARLELDPKQTVIRITPPNTPTPEQAARFNANELVRAAVLSRKSNLDQSVTRALLIKLGQTLETEAEQGLLAHLAEALGDPQMGVRIGKSAIARGFNLLMYAYPINAMPAYPALRPPPEPALILSITRQESEFDTTILSGAGARGLMQVMTVTAQHVCHDYRVKCEIDRLSRDPAYNAMMASAYIADRMDEFQGSYVLTIAGYNAGPGRARQWMKEFGDPRAANADAVDWIHRIPFEETREYVQKVLSNMQIYRARLGGEADALRLTADLHRVAIAPPRRSAPTSLPAAQN